MEHQSLIYPLQQTVHICYPLRQWPALQGIHVHQPGRGRHAVITGAKELIENGTRGRDRLRKTHIALSVQRIGEHLKARLRGQLDKLRIKLLTKSKRTARTVLTK
jgi:hypothetical protein